jgi:cytochrome P450
MSRLPPGPPPSSWLTGHLRAFADDRLAFLRACAGHGDVSAFRLVHHRALLVNRADLVHQVLVDRDHDYIKHFGVRLYRPAWGDGLIAREGLEWQRHRRLANPWFHRDRIAGYAPFMTDAGLKAAAGWRVGQPIDLYAEMARLTSAIVLEVLFGVQPTAERDQFSARLHDLFLGVGRRFRQPVPLPLWVPTPAHRQIAAARRELFRLIDGFIAHVRTDGRNASLLGHFLTAADENNRRLSTQELRDEAMTFYIAGHETTALTLAWAWRLLAAHPDADRRVADEWRRVLGGRPPEATDVADLTYTAAVVKESMRLYPPVYLFGREARRRTRIGDYDVPRGTTVLMCQWLIHRDGRYFPDPAAFRPDRWTKEFEDRLPPGAYFPFGGGQRTCIGMQFAIQEAVLLLATIGQRYRFVLDQGYRDDFWLALTLRPRHGIPALVEARVV